MKRRQFLKKAGVIVATAAVPVGVVKAVTNDRTGKSGSSIIMEAQRQFGIDNASRLAFPPALSQQIFLDKYSRRFSLPVSSGKTIRIERHNPFVDRCEAGNT